jgi:dCMP deaminase
MAIILSSDGRIIGAGYNGSPPKIKHCQDGHCPRAINPTEPGQDYSNCIAIHAESNALLFSDRTMRMGGTLYINGRPCYDCAKLIAGSGIARLVNLYNSYDSWKLSLPLLNDAGVEVTEYQEEDLP